MVRQNHLEVPARQRSRTQINSRLEKNLTTYVAAAGAAGVGLMALTNAAQGKVVYTPANITLTLGSPQPVDLNGDGIADVNLDYFDPGYARALNASAPAGNGVRLANNTWVAAGFFGVPVGPGEKFGTKSNLPMYFKEFGHGSSSYFASGPWVNVTNRYLGVKFVIAGTTHYGWVRMTTGKFPGPVITGYAYETIPNTSIKSGSVSGPNKETVGLGPLARASQPAVLGLLARGADAISIWRREEAPLINSRPASNTEAPGI